MKKILPFVFLALIVVYVARTVLPPKNEGDFDLVGFGQIPLLANGRIKPLDTVARSTLLQLQGHQKVASPEGQPLVGSPTEWLLDVAFRPEKADTYPIFNVDNVELLALFQIQESSLKIEYTKASDKIRAIVGSIPSHRGTFSYKELEPHLSALIDQVKLAQPVEAAVRTPFQRGVVQLYTNLLQYNRLQQAFVMPGRDDFLSELLNFQDKVTALRATQAAGRQPSEASVNELADIGQRFIAWADNTNFRVVPPHPGIEDQSAWETAGGALIETFQTNRVDATTLAYAGFAQAWRNNRPEQFNKLVELFQADLSKRFAPQLDKAKAEARFNNAAPFSVAMRLYTLAFLAAIFSWLVWPQGLGRFAFGLIVIGWILATVGIITRMWLEGRPPVTNLYSSALFVGWGAVTLCIILEWLYKNGVGSAAAGALGFATLLIAHQLSLSGDTLEMMRAVLDSNFWLATHVVVVVIGYSATFLAGAIAVIYIFRGVVTRSLDKATADSLSRMVYGIICFATLFSFVGTVLGGIWGDQSWGRFWGWDPKENGALIIVMWNALILHARWGGMIKQRGLMALAVFGNIVTSWSWFGVNMLGVGLHSYGFMDEAFQGLVLWVASQLVFIGLANIPLANWRSAKAMAVATPAPKREMATV